MNNTAISAEALAPASNPFTALWTQQGHQLCTGRWCIEYNGLPLNLPLQRREIDMNTWGIYSFIYEDDLDFAEGLKQDDWIIANVEWLLELFEQHNIPMDKDHMQYFYQVVSAEDWRCGSCGGCI